MKTLSIFFILLGTAVSAQQDALITTYWNNYAIFNPATSGLEYKHQTAITYRSQWVGVTGAPKTLIANYNTLLSEHHGLGINYIYETIGFTDAQYLHLNYNYQIKIDEDRKIALGISPGFYNLRFNGTWIPPSTYPDPSLPINKTNFDVNGGVAYQGKSIYAGVGIKHLLEFRKYKNSVIGYEQAPHIYAHLRNEFKMNRKFKLYLEGILRAASGFYSTDFNARALLFNKLTLGTGYRFHESFSFYGSWDFKEKYRLGYSYDLQQQNLPLYNYSKGSHEITIGLKIPHAIKYRYISMPNF